jgi:hypothetical protein
MRNAFLYSLPIAIVAVAGCGSQPKEQATRSDLERDLTLVPLVRETAVASAVELGRLPSQTGSTTSLHRVVRHRRAHRSIASSPKPAPPAPATRPVIADVPAPRPVAQPTAVPADSHELPPGKTVTVIPVSSGPSSGTGGGGADDIPMRGTGGSGMGGGGSGMGGGGSGMGGGGSGMGGGGDCPGWGAPGIGIASRPRGMLY